MSVRSGARVFVNAPLLLESDSLLRIERGSSYVDSGTYSLRTSWTVEFRENVTVRMVAMTGLQGNPGTMWLALSSPFLLTSTVNLRLEGEWPNDPGVSNVPLLQAGAWSNFVDRPTLNFTVDVKWSDPRKTVSRYSCATDLFIYVLWDGIVRSWFGRSETEDNCGLYRDMIFIMGVAIVFAAAAVWALWLHFRQPPFTTPAPPLEKEETCSVCLQPCEQPVLVRCKHRFCDSVRA